MPIPMDFSQSRAAIQRFNQFLQYDTLDKRASQRRMRQEELSNALAMGRIEKSAELEGGLEEKKSGLRMEEAQRKVLIDIARDPRFDQITAMVHLGRVGELPPGSEHLAKEAQAELKPMFEKLTNALFAVQKGETQPDNYQSLLDGFGSQAAQWATERTSVNINARRQQKIEEERNRIAGMTAGTEAGKFVDRGRLEFKTMVERARDYLQAQGVAPVGGLSPAIRQAMATAGSFPDPLSPKVRGQALQWLNEIDMQLSKGQPLSPEQEKFVSSVYNTWEIEGKGAAGPGAPAAAAGTGAGGGYGNLPHPTTGEVATDAAIGESKAREAAIRMAKKSMQEVMHPPVSPNELAFAKDVEGRWATATPEEKNRASSILERAYYTPTAEEDAWLMEKATEYYDTVLSPKPTIKK